jgi:hypothetical protein
MPARQMGKTKLEICAKLGISEEVFDAYIDAINEENNNDT